MYIYRERQFGRNQANTRYSVLKLKHPLKVQSCKLDNNNYMTFSIRITNTKIFAFIAVLVFKLLSRKILFINRKDNRNW